MRRDGVFGRYSWTMDSLIELFGKLGDLLLVVLGFSLIVFLHELGHFVAARWAGIRVLAFALGFGPAIVSYRKGMGWKRGSSEREYIERLRSSPVQAATISPTEYRLNGLPFGGYVRMLGQDDLDPTAVSTASDSYQSCAVWKRMVVISAGVVMNIITAAIMFIMVFMIGLKTEPAKIGDVQPGSPAATAMAVNADLVGVREPGLKAGDVVTFVNGRAPNSFNDLILATAMAKRGETVSIRVERPGVKDPLAFEITPRQSTISKLLDIGVGPSLSSTLATARNATEEKIAVENLGRMKLAGVKPGMALVRINRQTEISSGHDLDEAIRQSGGKPVELEFADATSNERVIVSVPTVAELQTDLLPRPDGSVAPYRHIAGLTPVMTVGRAQDPAIKQGLADGDIFARLGAVEYPSVAQGRAEIRRNAGKKMPVVVVRKDGDVVKEVAFDVEVSREGTIGFEVGETDDENTLLAIPAEVLQYATAVENQPESQASKTFRPPAAGAVTQAGSRLLAINGNTVRTLAEARDMLRSISISALAETQPTAKARLTIEPPRLAADPSTPRTPVDADITLDDKTMRSIAALSWTAPAGSWMFKLEEFTLQASGPLSAIHLGIDETKRVMTTTYLTFARLFEGTVKVEHLKGPVGIAHIGTRLADRGLVWLVFFMALISVNLAVVNFLPLPIVDGGQFLFLLFEAIRGKPVPVAVQNAVTLAGLVMIGSVFLLVTFNDIRNLFGM
jgi:regulator of sigma E protease